jgi:hypothetical protein
MKIENISDLESAILILEKRAVNQKQLLSDKFSATYESLKPKNLLHATVTNITESSNLKNVMLIGVAAISVLAIPIFPAKKLFGISSKIMRKVAGIAINIGVQKVAAKYSTKIKSGGSSFFKGLINKFVQK